MQFFLASNIHPHSDIQSVSLVHMEAQYSIILICNLYILCYTQYYVVLYSIFNPAFFVSNLNTWDACKYRYVY